MAASPITQTINHLCEIGVSGAVMGVIGYLAGHVVTRISPSLQVTPEVGLVCGATAGIIIQLFHADGANWFSKIVAIAAIIAAPFKICEKLNLPVTFNAALLTTFCVIIISNLFYKIFE